MTGEIRRWGKKYVDKRNWSEYNRSLIRRGKVLLGYSTHEYVSAKKFVNMEKELATKVTLYNLFMQMTPHGG